MKNEWSERTLFSGIMTIILISTLLFSAFPGYSQTDDVPQGSRPAYIYDRADIVSEVDEILLDEYLRSVDDATSAEIVVYTIPSFVGHGISKDGIEIHDRDMLANYIFNEVSLDGIEGIGKDGKDNGILLLISTSRDAAGGSIRLEIGRGLEGVITDGTAGQVLDAYLAPARAEYEESGDASDFSNAIYDTVITLGELVGYSTSDSIFEPSARVDFSSNAYDAERQYIQDRNLFIIVIIGIIVAGIIAVIAYKKGQRSSGGNIWIPSAGGFDGGGSAGKGGGGGESGGGGAGR